ncbi:MAG: KH domain-containing protein [Acidobacteria bacterium]|nr:KH domain-containing protein [Acidobacteriota bacterium]MBV9146825.1 KH domain-containing protein [Acidobacteriota bacterium]MBV9436417.1 KH domain-containing protein [Acidobacteriota bacterium]
MPTEQGGDVRELVLQIAKALVDEPALVTVEAIDGPESTVLELRVAQRDLGKVIGKQGRTARSLRTIIGAASMKLRKRHTLEIIEDGLPGGASSQTAAGEG